MRTVAARGLHKLKSNINLDSGTFVTLEVIHRHYFSQHFGFGGMCTEVCRSGSYLLMEPQSKWSSCSRNRHNSCDQARVAL